MPEECATELRVSAVQSLTLVTTICKHTVGALIECERFSTLPRLLRVTALVLEAIELFKRNYGHIDTTLTSSQTSQAELLWIKDVQQSMSQKSDFNLLKKQFNLFMDEKGVWRCAGRLSNADLL